MGLTLVALLGLGATVVTHHLTAYALVAFLVLWVAAGRLAGRLAGPGRVELPGSAGLALLAVVVSLAWLLYVGGLTVSYLAPIFERGLQDVSRWLAEGSTGRRLFQDASGRSSPLWEQVVAYGAVASLLLALPFGLWGAWRRYRHNAAALALAAGALAYPVSLALRLTPRGLEIANRASEFLFLAVAFVVAVAVCGPSPESAPGHGRTARPAPLRRWAPPAFGAWVALLFAGGIVLGWPAFARLPGPYRPAAPVRSIDPQAVAAAEWTRQYLGPGNRVASDVSNQLTLAAYGAQRSETNGYHVPRLFLSSEVGPEERETIRNWRIRYLVVDQRLSQSLPMIGIYYGMWEPDGYNHARPVGQAALAKFDAVPEVHRLLHSGDVVVYDVGRLAGAP